MRFLTTLIALAASCSGAVIEATDADIDTYLNNGIPAIVDLWAPWCGHCKTFAPKFDEIAALYEHLTDKIQFIKVDGESNRATAKKFKLEYFPTVKFVDGTDHEEIQDRSINNIKQVIESKLGITPEDAPSEPAKVASGPKVSRDDVGSHVVELRDENFETAVDGKHALVAFTTDWCHYCKALQPEWQEGAKLYAHDEDILFGNVDCTDSEAAEGLMSTFHVDGYPTIVYFPADGSVPKPYAGPRTLDGFVEFLKRVGASQREITGELSSDAGLIPDIDLSDLALAKKKVELSESPYKALYLRIIEKAAASSDYIARETDRLSRLLDSHKKGTSVVRPESADSFQIRLNILNSFAFGGSETASDSKEREL